MSIEVIRPGINTTFQDRGRSNLYHLGIPFSGAMDTRNLLITNKLVGNDKNDAVIEFALQGPKFKVKQNNINCVVTGNVSFTFKKNSKIYNGECYKTFDLNNNDEIDIISTNNSMYGYFSISGGFKIEKKWNSYSTHLRSKVGPNRGNKIVENDILQLNKNVKPIIKKSIDYSNSKIEFIRVIKGTNFDYFSKDSQKSFFESQYQVTNLTDRMGMRLDGKKLNNIKSENIKSEGLIKGVIQVPPDGKPIVMLSDHGTIGGYPKIGVIISADYDKIVQLPPMSKIKFKMIDIINAEKLFKLYSMETKNILNQI